MSIMNINRLFLFYCCVLTIILYIYNIFTMLITNNWNLLNFKSFNNLIRLRKVNSLLIFVLRQRILNFYIFDIFYQVIIIHLFICFEFDL